MPELATVGQRLGARLIDIVIVGLVRTVLILLFAYSYVGWLLAIVAGIAYEVALTARSGQTLGKRAVGIYAGDALTGEIPTFAQSMRRAAPLLVALVPIVAIAGPVLYLPVFWDPRRQGWHDRLAGTLVVRVPPAAVG